MAGNEKIILDAGHGGDEPGAIYNGRKEKDDTLRLTLAVGRILEENGVSTLYTRTTDVYNSCLLYTSYSPADVTDYIYYDYRKCPLCEKGVKLDALVNAYGYTTL